MTAEDGGEGDALDVTFEMPRGSLEGATFSATIGAPLLRHPGRDAVAGLGRCALVCASGAGRGEAGGGGDPDGMLDQNRVQRGRDPMPASRMSR